MSDCCNYFQFTDPGDSFASWEGRRGPKGDPGPQGEPGQGLVIQGIVATVGDLPASANQGDVYLVGASDPYEGYLWTNGAWEDIGELAMGPEGPQGPAGTITVGTVTGLPAGSTPTVVNTGTAEAAVLDFGIPAGADGAPGQDGAPGPGVAAGGSAMQYLVKQSATDYDTAWETRANIVNPNLLENWYFVKGSGTTGNYGVFPINQRAQASYSNANAYTIDRWKLTSGSLTVASGGITLNGTIVQILPASVGLSVVASALLSDGTMITPTYDDSTMTFTLTATGQTIVAAKLEIGSVQTLAHAESGSWVLNEIPEYGEQLANCQKWFYKASTIYSSGWITKSSTEYQLPITTPVPMVKRPTATMSHWIGRNAAGYLPESPSTSNPRTPNITDVYWQKNTNIMLIKDTLSSASTIANNTIAFFQLEQLTLSAEP